MNKILWPGFLAGVVILVSDLIVNRLVNFFFPLLEQQYMTSIFRPWSDPRMMLYFLYPFIVGVIMAFIWSKTKGLFTGITKLENGRIFGLISCLVFVLPGMFVTYTSFTVSFALILSWTISGVIGLILAGIVLAKIAE